MILDALRSGTAELHASLEAALPLGGAQLSRTRYIEVLQGFRGFFAGWERRASLVAPASLQPLLQERARARLLDADLRALSAQIPALVATEFPDMRSNAALLGSMYVLEGSRLGGQYLVRDLEQRLGLTPDCGLAFFYGFGSQTGSKWKAFCQILIDEVRETDTAVAVQAARSTFLAFKEWVAPGSEDETARVQIGEPVL